MYCPEIYLKASGVPYLSKREISAIGDAFIKDFSPEALINPKPIDLEAFTTNYLGMTQEHRYLSHNGVYLGMTVFNDTDELIVFSPETNRAEYASAKARTIIIDSRLLGDIQEHRYRFTLGHECGHGILHNEYFKRKLNKSEQPMIQCRTDVRTFRTRTDSKWSDYDWMEWQANHLASALLMPETAVRRIAARYRSGVAAITAKVGLVERLTETFDVSPEAATWRLKDFGIFKASDSRIYTKKSVAESFLA